MGDPRRLRKKFSQPGHPWNRERIDEEKKISKEFGLLRKQEIWKTNSRLKKYFTQAKNFIASSSAQADKESKQLLSTLTNLGALPIDSKIEDVMNVQLKDLLERRLQTIVVRKNFARSMKQARQLIVHEHISIGGQKITSPSYLVSLAEEPKVQFSVDSPMGDEAHPERVKKEEKPAEAEESPKEEKAQETKSPEKESKAEEKPSKSTEKKESSQEKKPSKAPAKEEKPKDQEKVEEKNG